MRNWTPRSAGPLDRGAKQANAAVVACGVILLWSLEMTLRHLEVLLLGSGYGVPDPRCDDVCWKLVDKLGLTTGPHILPKLQPRF